MTLAVVIARNAAFAPDKAAIHFDGKTLSYAAFHQRIERAAYALATEYRIGLGDRVAILSQNRPDYLVLLYACARLGAILVPLNWRLAAPELAYMLDHSAPKLLVMEQAFAAVLADIAATKPRLGVVWLNQAPSGGTTIDNLIDGIADRPADNFLANHLGAPLLLVYTSGTTGRPKGAVLTQRALMMNSAMSHHMHGLTADDHVLSVLPFFHVGGLNIQTTPALHFGATVTIHPRFTPEATLAAFAQARPTLTVLVPATIDAVTSHPAWPTTDLSSLRAITTGSSIVPQPLIDRVEARGVPVLQVYGATETCPIAIYTRIGCDRSRIGSTGLPGFIGDATVMDEHGTEQPAGATGEIAVRGPTLFAGYWNDAAATAEVLVDGWYRTGDLGHRDADGYFYVHDRKRNTIISGGENIYPAEIERVLLEHPDVIEAGVVGLPDPVWQETPTAFVMLRADATAAPEALKRHVAAHLARYKVPREIVIVTDLPRTALGKVQHFRLKQMALGSGPS